MVRGLDGFTFLSRKRQSCRWYPVWRTCLSRLGQTGTGCAVLKGPEGEVSRLFPVALARGKHLFPFRTEQLSPSAPMVLGSQGPGRVGRRRFFHTRAAFGRPVVVPQARRWL